MRARPLPAFAASLVKHASPARVPERSAFDTKALALALFSLLLVLPACPRPLTFGPEGRLRDPAKVLSLVRAAEQQTTSLKGQASLDVNSPQVRGRVTLFIAVARPARVHVEQLDFFGRPSAVLAIDGDRFNVFEQSEGKFYRGPANDSNIRHFSPVPLGPGELVNVLLGGAPSVSGEPGELSLDEARGEYVLPLTEDASGRRSRLRIATDSLRVDSAEVESPERYRVELTERQHVGGSMFPKRIALEAPTEHTRVGLHYEDVELNVALDAALFSLEPPPGVQVIELTAEGRLAAPVP